MRKTGRQEISGKRLLPSPLQRLLWQLLQLLLLVLSAPHQCSSSETLRDSIDAGSLEDLGGDDIGIHVGGGATVLEISALLRLRGARNPDRCTTVRDPVAELVDRGGLVRAGQPPLISLAICLDVLHVLLAQLLDRADDLPVATSGAHLGGRVVRVAAS